ncbi:hypothetical protein BLS_003763 [Venturia inaequalis]|uniref:Peptidase A2 domain-containing protein n=1 Tax=Venturia inaequalis TaxID=5025 RepID=A0A8H3UNW0_VENIN|nr:hypothetical protein BLS_003763 [Venturia inaequalis]
MFPQKFPESMLSPCSTKVALGAAALASVPALLLWVKRKASAKKDHQDNFIRTLEIFPHNKHTDPCRINAKLDTGADYSLISKAIVRELGLHIQHLDLKDAASVLLADHSEFHVQGKVTLRFHVTDSPTPQSVFRFGKYVYEATFFVPADVDICSFDAYIGADIIHEHHLQESFFFSGSNHGRTPAGWKDPAEPGTTPAERAKRRDDNTKLAADEAAKGRLSAREKTSLGSRPASGTGTTATGSGTETSKADASDAETSQTDTNATVNPKPDASTTETTPKANASETETSSTDTSATVTPKTDTSATETPKTDTSAKETS